MLFLDSAALGDGKWEEWMVTNISAWHIFLAYPPSSPGWTGCQEPLGWFLCSTFSFWSNWPEIGIFFFIPWPCALHRLCWISSPFQLPMWSCPSLLSFAIIITMAKATMGGKALFYLKTPRLLREVRTWTEGRNQSRSHRGMLLTGLLSVACSLCFFPINQVHQPRSGAAYSGLDLPPSVSNQESSSTDIPAGQCDGGSSFIEDPFSLVCWHPN